MNSLEILKYIQSKHKDFSLKNGILSFDTAELTIKVDIAQVNNNNGIYVAQLIFILSHPLFDTDLVESVAGIGKTKYDAILDGTDKFYMNVLLTIVSTLKCENDNTFECKLLKEKRIFHRNCFDNILSCGVRNPEAKPLWNLVEDIIPKYLGTKKFYWLKLFVSVNSGNVTCEARLNNQIYESLAKPLERYVNSWSNKTDYHTEKQYILLIQDNSTYKPAPFSKDTITEYTKQAITLFESIQSQEDYNSIEDRIFKITNDRNLTTELKVLIPEIYCKIALRIENQVDDKIMLVKENSSSIDLHTSQIRSYSYIEETIYKHIYENRPSNDKIMNAISSSTMFSSINNAMNNGSKIENLFIGGVVMFVDNSYTPW